MRSFAWTMVFSAMLFQFSAQTIQALSDLDYAIELVGLDGQEESEEKEQQEEENKEEKSEIPLLSSPSLHFALGTHSALDGVNEPRFDFSMEIPIPPPQQL